MSEATSTMGTESLPNPGEHSGVLALDLALGHWMRRRALAAGATEEAAHVLAITAVLVAQERGRGHTCIHLPRWAERSMMLPPSRQEHPFGSFPTHEDMQPFALPAVRPWLDVLQKSSLVGRGTSPTPLVLGPKYRLYLYRYWAAEQRLSRHLRCLLEPLPGEDPADPSPALQDVFQRLFPPPEDSGAMDHQALAASLALRRRLCLISGGPGTGKTTTVSRLLALWLHVDPDLRIGLAAPTGKAAARLVESIAQQVDGLELPPELLERFPRQAATLHRLLGYQRRQGRFRHRAGHPLPYDLLVVDEASMVDLLMMDALADALPKGGRLILIGDQNQLSSVETGFVFGDLCRGAQDAGWSPEVGEYFEQLSGYGIPQHSDMDSMLDSGPDALDAPSQDTTLRDTAVELQTNYRFRSQPGIGALAQSIRDQHAHRCLDVLDNRQLTDVERRIHPPDLGPLLEPLRGAFRAVLEAPDPQQALQQMEGFRILAATRRGQWGVEQLNPRIDRWLQDQGWIDEVPALADDEGHRWYAGRPIMVTHNDYGVQLFNGDVGICAASEKGSEQNGLRAFFPDGQGGVRTLALSKLPPHATAWSMTVHKSQGSEFDHVLLILPEKDTPLLTRELLYTAVTRARRHLTVAASNELITQAIDRRSRRTSGLLDALRGKVSQESETEMREPDVSTQENLHQDVEEAPEVPDTPPPKAGTTPHEDEAIEDDGSPQSAASSQAEPRQLSLFDPPPDSP